MKTILVVDDTPQNITVIAHILQEDYRIVAATSAGAALKKVEQEIPDLILLDIMMPGTDGFEVCKTLKMLPHSKDIPVIFITAMSDVDTEVRAFKLGAEDFITKPISPPILKARVDRIFR